MMFHAASYHPQIQACNSTPVSNGSSGMHMTKLNIDLISNSVQLYCHRNLIE